MLVAVMLQNHDYEPCMEFVDTDKLDKSNYVDMELLKAIEAGEDSCYIDASNWEDEPDKFPHEDIGISENAKVKKPSYFEYAIMLTIDFNC